MSSFFTQTTRLQSNPSAGTGAPKYDQTYVYGQSTSTLRHSDTVLVPTSGTITLPAIPGGWTAVDHVTMVNCGAAGGAVGSEVWVNLVNGVNSVGVVLIAPISGNASGGQLSFDMTATAGQTTPALLPSTTLALPAGAGAKQMVEIVYWGH